MESGDRRPPWATDSRHEQVPQPAQDGEDPPKKGLRKRTKGVIVTSVLLLGGAAAYVNNVGEAILLPFQAHKLMDDGRNPTLDSPMGIIDSPFATPYPCHFLGALENAPEEFDDATMEDFYDSHPTPFGIGQVSFTATAEGESSYTVTDTRLTDIKPIDDDEVGTYVDALVSACGGPADTAVIAEYDFADPSSRHFQDLTDLNDARTTDQFPPSSVTSSSSLTIHARVNSCESSYRFNIEIDYTKSGSDEVHTKRFGPYTIYSPKGLDPESWTRCRFGYAASVRVAEAAVS